MCNNTPATVITQACSGEDVQEGSLCSEGGVERRGEVGAKRRRWGWMATFIHPHPSSPPSVVVICHFEAGFGGGG